MNGQDKLDETLNETFPASDAPANTTETGVRLGADAVSETAPAVVDNPAAHRFEVHAGGRVGFLQYWREGGSITLIHTEVPAELRGRGLAALLVKHALETARARGWTVHVRCPYVTEYLKTHPELRGPVV